MKTTIRLIIGDKEYMTWDLPDGAEATDKVSLTMISEQTGQTLLMDFDIVVTQPIEGGGKDDVEKIYALTYAFSPRDNQIQSIIRNIGTKKGG